VRARSETPCTEPCCPAPIDTNITCFNYNKLGHFASICLEPRKRDLKEIEEEELYKPEENKSGKKEP
jgi:hypothetical protein